MPARVARIDSPSRSVGEEIFGHGEIELDDAGVIERGDDVAGADQRADADATQAHAPGERRADHGVFEPRLRRAEPRAIRLERGLELVEAATSTAPACCSSSRLRLYWLSLSVTAACAAATSARACASSSCTSTWPRFTRSPSRNVTAVTMLEVLVLMSTDSLARALPSASSFWLTRSRAHRARASRMPARCCVAPAPAAGRRRPRRPVLRRVDSPGSAEHGHGDADRGDEIALF